MATTNVGGRPQKDDEDRRTNRLTIHLSDDEKTRLEAEARASGLRVAAFVRARVLGTLGRDAGTDVPL